MCWRTPTVPTKEIYSCAGPWGAPCMRQVPDLFSHNLHPAMPKTGDQDLETGLVGIGLVFRECHFEYENIGFPRLSHLLLTKWFGTRKTEYEQHDSPVASKQSITGPHFVCNWLPAHSSGVLVLIRFNSTICAKVFVYRFVSRQQVAALVLQGNRCPVQHKRRYSERPRGTALSTLWYRLQTCLRRTSHAKKKMNPWVPSSNLSPAHEPRPKKCRPPQLSCAKRCMDCHTLKLISPSRRR